VNWNKIWTPATLEDNLTFGHMMGMLVIDAFLYGLVTWYIEAVFPGQYGMPQPWYFFLMVSSNASIVVKTIVLMSKGMYRNICIPSILKYWPFLDIL